MAFFSQPAETTQNQVPEGVCPNCWGKQEYDSEIRELRKDKQIDVNNHEANYAFIQDFVVNKVEGIKLQKLSSGASHCPYCKTNYKDTL